MIGLFDSHAHYDDEKFDSDREEVIKGLHLKTDVNPIGVYKVLNCGCNIETSKKAIEFTKKYDSFYASIGLHPEYADGITDDFENTIKSMLTDKVVAIGEIGLDYYYDGASKEKQKEVFERQIILANELDLPIIVHDREAHGDCFDMVRKYKGTKGVFHSFSGSFEMAKELVKLGFYISFSGSVTFKNAVNITRSVLAVPDDRLLVETDSPYLTPVPFRGRRNDSSYVYHTAKKLAEIRGTTVEKIAEQTFCNAENLFGINQSISE